MAASNGKLPFTPTNPFHGSTLSTTSVPLSFRSSKMVFENGRVIGKCALKQTQQSQVHERENLIPVLELPWHSNFSPHAKCAPLSARLCTAPFVISTPLTSKYRCRSLRVTERSWKVSNCCLEPTTHPTLGLISTPRTKRGGYGLDGGASRNTPERFFLSRKRITG